MVDDGYGATCHRQVWGAGRTAEQAFRPLWLRLLGAGGEPGPGRRESLAPSGRAPALQRRRPRAGHGSPGPGGARSSWAEEATRLIAPDSRYTGGRLSPLGLHVDLAVLPRRRLRRLPCTLFNFDLQSARVLVGKEVLAELPSFRPSDIPAREALLLLGNRCLSLCESAGHPEANTAQWMYYHALKAIIDAGAALMILSGRYRTRIGSAFRCWRACCALTFLHSWCAALICSRR